MTAPLYTTLGAMLAAQAARHGNKPALKSASGDLSYATLDRAANRVAHGLAAAGVGPGDRVACIGRNGIGYWQLLFGAARLGATAIPVNWRLAPAEIDAILDDAAPRFIAADMDFASVLPGNAAHVLTDTDSFTQWRDSFSDAHPDMAVDPETIAVQIYTSGTTGKPKGVMLSHRALMAFRALPPEMQPAWNRWTDDDVSLIVMPQFHIGGTGFGLQTLCAGATGLIQQAFDASAVLDAIANDGLSKFFTVPSALQLVLQHPRARSVNYDRIRTIVYGASPIPLELLRAAIGMFDCAFVQQYGMTEMCGTIAVLPPEDHSIDGNARMRSAGKPLPGVDVAILDPDGRALPPHVSGEIAIRAPTVMSGYWNQPDATAAVMTPDGFFRTGDAGYLDEDGYIFLQDRLKDMIVSGGENIYPAEVEAALWAHPDIAEVAVIGVPDPLWGEAVKAIVVLHDSVTPDAEAIRQWARARIGGYKVPKSVDFVASLPRNATGKVLRRELRAPYWAGHARAIN